MVGVYNKYNSGSATNTIYNTFLQVNIKVLLSIYFEIIELHILKDIANGQVALIFDGAISQYFTRIHFFVFYIP